MNPEARARQNIDAQLAACGWEVQDRARMNLFAGRGVAVREFPTTSGPADYMLFVDRRAVGVIEAKAEGDTLSGVAEQAADYAVSLPPNIPHVSLPLPFLYESTGVETYFRDERDPAPRSRRVYSFHRPETLAEWVDEGKDRSGELIDQIEDSTRRGGSALLTERIGNSNRPARTMAATLRGRLREMPERYPLITSGLWSAQAEAIAKLERSFVNDQPRALIQMATGSGKTFTAVNFVYRLIKFAKARRVLFLVDRNNLGRQAFKEFDQFITPDDGRKFTELYNVQHLQSNLLDDVSKVHITTIQRLYSMLCGEAEFDPANEETSLWEVEGALDRPVTERGTLQPAPADRVLRLYHHRRVPPLDLPLVAAGIRIFRRVLDRADGHAQQANLRLLQPEPGDGVFSPAGGGGWGQCGWGGVPHPHANQRARQHD